MKQEETVQINVTEVPLATQIAIKKEAATRRLKMNTLWLKVIESGRKRLKIVKESD